MASRNRMRRKANVRQRRKPMRNSWKRGRARIPACRPSTTPVLTGNSLRSAAQIELAGAVAEGFHSYSRAIEEGQEQIRRWRRLRELDVMARYTLPDRLTGDHQRQIRVRMNIAVAERAPVQDCRMIKQRAVAILRC